MNGVGVKIHAGPGRRPRTSQREPVAAGDQQGRRFQVLAPLQLLSGGARPTAGAVWTGERPSRPDQRRVGPHRRRSAGNVPQPLPRRVGLTDFSFPHSPRARPARRVGSDWGRASKSGIWAHLERRCTVRAASPRRAGGRNLYRQSTDNGAVNSQIRRGGAGGPILRGLALGFSPVIPSQASGRGCKSYTAHRQKTPPGAELSNSRAGRSQPASLPAHMNFTRPVRGSAADAWTRPGKRPVRRTPPQSQRHCLG